jgi:hypothetical protein
VDYGDDRFINSSELASRLDGYEIYPEQIHRNRINKNGYYWRNCTEAWDIYLTPEEKKQVESKAEVDSVDSVDACGGMPPEVDTTSGDRGVPQKVSTVSTMSTAMENRGGRSIAFQPTPPTTSVTDVTPVTDGGVSSSLSIPSKPPRNKTYKNYDDYLNRIGSHR